MSVTVYHVGHLCALMVMVLSMGGVLTATQRSKRLSMIMGLSSLVVLVAGFGMLHRLHYDLSAKWVIGKLLIWLCLSVGVPVVARRFPSLRIPALGVVAGLLMVAVWLAVVKP
ncbi:hypothetical protein EBZ35_03390 [bacterium]|nr:hypothetical protein [bacterium]